MADYDLIGKNLTELLPGSIPIGWSTRLISFGGNQIADVQPGAFPFLSYPRKYIELFPIINRRNYSSLSQK